jgi:hypothetical protein
MPEKDDAASARLEAERELLAISRAIKEFQERRCLTIRELYIACFPDTAPVSVGRFEDWLNEKSLPKRLTFMRKTIERLRAGLKQAEAAHDPNHLLYQVLALLTGRGEAARSGFDLYVGTYRFYRLGSGGDLVHGTIAFYYHPTGLDPHYRQEHEQEINGNTHCFVYEGPVLIMPRNLSLVGFRPCEIRVTDLLCTDPAKECLTGEFLTQRYQNCEPFSGKIVLYRDDLWERSKPSEKFLRNLLRDAKLRKRA